MSEQRAMSFGELVRLKDSLASEPFFSKMELPQFSQYLNEHTRSNVAGAGMKDNFARRANLAIEDFIAPVTNVTGQVGANVLGTIGGDKWADVGRGVGKTLLRGLVDAALTFSGVPPLMAVGVGDAAFSAYGETGSLGQAAVAGVGTGLAPGAARLGQNLASKALVASPLYKVADATGVRVPALTAKIGGVVDRLFETGGANVSLTGLQELQMQASSLVGGQGLRGFDEGHLTELVAGQLPFALVDAKRVLFGDTGVARSSTANQQARLQTEKSVEMAAMGKEVESTLKTFNKNRLLLPAPKTNFFGDDTGTVASSVTEFPGSDERLGPSRPTIIEINDMAMSPEMWDKVTKAEVLLAEQKTITRGSLKKKLGVTDEEVEQVFNALGQRGIVGAGPDKYRVVQQVPNVREIMMEQLRRDFPLIHGKLTQPEVAQQPVIDVESSVVPAKVVENPADAVISSVMAQRPNALFEEIWSVARKQNIDYFDFKKAWRPYEKQQAEQVKFSSQGPDPYFERKRLATDPATQYRASIEDAAASLEAKGQPPLNTKLILNPKEEIALKQHIGTELKRILREQFEGNPDALIAIANYDVDSRLKRLEDYGNTPAEIVRRVLENGTREFSELSVQKLAAEEATQGVFDAYTNTEMLKIPAYKKQLELINRWNTEELASKFDPGFGQAEKYFEEQIREARRKKELGYKNVEAPTEFPRTPFDVLDDVRTGIDNYELTKYRGRMTQASDTEAKLKPADYVRAAFVEFYDGKQPHIAAFLKKYKGRYEDAQPHEIEAAALEDYMMTKGQRRAKNIESIARKKTGMETYADPDSPVGDSKEAAAQAAVMYTRSDEAALEYDPALYAREQATFAKLGVAMGEKLNLTMPKALQIREAATGKKKAHGLYEWKIRIEKALQWVKDGAIGTIPATRKNSSKLSELLNDNVELDIRQGKGLMPTDLKVHLGFKYDTDAYAFLRTDFAQVLGYIGKQINDISSKGGDISSVFKDAEVKFSKQRGEGKVGETQQPVQEQVAASTPLALLTSTKKFYETAFKVNGMSDSQASLVADVAVKIAAQFGDLNYARVAGLVSDVVNTKSGPTTIGGAALSGADKRKDIAGMSSLKDIKDNPTRVWSGMLTLGHELAHIFKTRHTENLTDPRWADLGGAPESSYIKAFQQAESMTPEERSVAISQLLFSAVPESVSKSPWFNEFLDARTSEAARSAEEFMADYTGLLTMGIASPNKATAKDFIEDFQFRPDWETDFAKHLYVNFGEMLGAIELHMKALFGNESKTPSTIAQIGENVKSALRSLEQTDKAIAVFRELSEARHPAYLRALDELPHNVDPQKEYEVRSELGFSMQSAVNKLRTSMGQGGTVKAEKYLGVQPGFWDRWFTPARQLAEKYPQFRDVVDLGYSYIAMARQAQAKILEPFLTTTSLGRKAVDFEGKGVKKVVSNPEALEVFNKLALIKNERESLMHPEDMRKFIVAEAPSLGKDTQDAIISVHNAMEQAAPVAAKILIDSKYDSLAHFAARAMMSADRTMTWKTADSAGREIVGALRGGIDPTQLITKYGPTVQNAMSLLAANSDKKSSLFNSVQNLEQNLLDKPWWTPEVRLGRYMVAWKDGAKGFDKQADAIRFHESRQAEGKSSRIWDKWEQSRDTAGMHPLMLDSFQKIERAAYDAALVTAGVDADTAAALREAYRPGENTWKEYTSKGFARHLMPRKLAEGREGLNVFQGFVEYVSGLTNGTSRQFTKNKFSLAQLDPAMRDQPALRNMGEQYMKTLLYPPAKEWSKVKEINFLYFLGGNLASMMVEYTQPLVTLMPFLTRTTNSPSKAFKYMAKSAKDIGSVFLSSEKKIEGMRKETTDVENAAMNRAAEEGVVDFGVLGDFFDLEDVAVANLKKLGQNDLGFLSKPAELTKNAASLYAKSMRTLYSNATRWNSRLAFLSAFRMAFDGHVQERGTKVPAKNTEAAYEYAVRTAHAAMFTGGPAGRPIGMFHNKGDLFGAVGAMYSLQSYSFNALSMMGRLMRESISKQPGMTATDQSAARKAAAQMLTAQVVMGGAMGLPLTGASLAVIEQFFEESEPKKKVREAVNSVASLFTDDLENQELLSDIAMRGAASQLTGVDVASRVQLSNLLGVDPYKGFDIANVIGPTGSVLKNLLQGVQKVSTGEFDEALRHGLPAGFKNIVDVTRDGSQIRDKEGRLIMTATPAEQFARVLGFKPNRLATWQEKANTLRTSEKVSAAQQDRFHTGLARLLLAGKPQEVRSAILQKAASESTYNPRTAAQLVVQIAQDLTYPFEPADSGSAVNANERQRITELYGGQKQQRVPEVQKLMQRKQIEQSLGIPGAGQVSNNEITRAQMIDQLLQMSPTTTRQEASMIVDQKLRPNARRF